MTQNRFSPIDPVTLPMLCLVAIADAEALIAARMAEVKARWTFYDPPFGAAYDVEGLEFDPIKICMEAGAASELNALSFVNAMGKATTLAFASGQDLDALASRYPNGVPRLQTGVDQNGAPIMESDARYQYRIWLSSNDFTTAGAGAAYVFQALTAVPQLRDATAIVTRDSLEKEPVIVISCLLEDNDASPPAPLPTNDQLLAVRARLIDPNIGTLTDVITVQAVNVIPVDIIVRLWFFFGADQAASLAAVNAALTVLIDRQKYLGYTNTLQAIYAVCAQYGVSQTVIDSPTQDVICDDTQAAIIQSVTVLPQAGLAFTQNRIVVSGLMASDDGQGDVANAVGMTNFAEEVTGVWADAETAD